MHCLVVALIASTHYAAAFVSPRSDVDVIHHSHQLHTQHQHHRQSALSASASSNELESPRTLIRKGMQSFRECDVPSSLTYFDSANDAVADASLGPFLWQRGISYYYLDMFKEGSEQVSDVLAFKWQDIAISVVLLIKCL